MKFEDARKKIDLVKRLKYFKDGLEYNVVIIPTNPQDFKVFESAYLKNEISSDNLTFHNSVYKDFKLAGIAIEKNGLYRDLKIDNNFEPIKNKLLIIGNGFDLTHNLETSYSHFIKFITNEIIKGILEPPSNSKYFELKTQLFLKYKYELQDHHKREINENNSQNLILELLELNILIPLNGFFKKLIEGNFTKNWVDIEQLYFDELKRLFKAKKINEIEKLNREFEELKIDFERYLKSINLDIGEVNKYLEIELFTKGIKDSLLSKVKKENKILDSIHILNFNYTETINRYFEFNQFNTINYIHGKLNDEKNPIIFGYGDESDSLYKELEKSNENEYLKYFKSFGYFKTQNYTKLLQFINFYKFDVYILGHSCGLSDRVMFKTIFEHENCENIQIFYHDKGNGENDYIEKTMNISRHFDSKSEMRKKIVPFELCIPLNKLNENIN